jgi:phage baseplate assembly protein W
MSIYKGFSTQDVNTPLSEFTSSATGSITDTPLRPVANRKTLITDKELVIRDLLNAFNIKQGDKPGKPSYGTTIWSYIFEPNTADVREEIEREVRRVVGQDPRINLESLELYSYENSVIVGMDVSFNPSGDFAKVAITLDAMSGVASQL